MRKVFSLIFIPIALVSCDSSVYNTYKPVGENGWHKDSIVTFNFTPRDTISKNNVYVNLRNNENYGYSNLWLIIGIEFPDATTVIDTLEYEMADPEGRFLGTGLTDLKENKLEYKTNVVFPTTGNYTFTVQQAMRKAGETEGIDPLKGITDVGISIEKTNAND